jgi:archaellin
MYRIFFLFIFLSLILATPTFAQFSDANLGSDISISAIPENPEPLESVILEIKSYSIDLNQANIAWRYNGKTVSSGIGRTRISIVAPNANNAGLVTATVTGTGFATSSTSIDLRTAKIDLLWEAADSYTPPFYKGKAMFIANGLIRVTAIQALSSPKNLSFEWSRNDSVALDASGYNKNSMVFRNETLKKQENISVIAQSGLFNGRNNISLTPTKPQIVLYQKIEGFIDYANGHLSALSTKAPGITLRFEPYFFSTPQNIDTNLTFDIKNNDNQLYGNQKQNEISLSRPDNGGQSNIEVSINTVVYSLQNALKQFIILFN